MSARKPAAYLIRRRVLDLWRRPADRPELARHVARICAKRIREAHPALHLPGPDAVTLNSGGPCVLLDGAPEDVAALLALGALALHFPTLAPEQHDAWIAAMDREAERVDMRTQRSLAQGAARRAKNYVTRDCEEDAAALLRAGKTRPEAERELLRDHPMTVPTLRRHMVSAGWQPVPVGRPKKTPKQ